MNRVKLRSIPPANRSRSVVGRTTRSQPAPDTAQKEWQPRKMPKGRFSSVPFDGGLRWTLERKIEQLREVEEFLAEGLKFGLAELAEELRKDIEVLSLKLK